MNNIETKLANLESRVEALEKLSDKQLIMNSDQFSKKEDKKTLNEFLRTKKLDDDVKRTLAIAYWLDKFEKVEFFNTTDIENGFRSARLIVPKNVNDKVNMNIKNGCLTDHKEKKESKKTWYITNTGIELIENDLNK
jgi:hypothetical protein